MSDQDAIAVELRKIAYLLALREVANLKKGEASRVLSTSGFSNREIAALLGTTESSVRAFLSLARKRATAPAATAADE